MGSSREERRRRFHEDLDAHEVRVIPAKEEYCIDIREKDELVGAYCRVSTMSDATTCSGRNMRTRLRRTSTGHWWMSMLMRGSRLLP